MKITICGSMKFNDEILAAKKELEAKGHTILLPVKVPTMDYWAEDNATRVKGKKDLGLIQRHFHKIEQADAILVVNISKGDIEHYIGGNTFLEIGFAYVLGKAIYLLNPIPKQPYIVDELEAISPIILNGDVSRI